MKKIVIAGFGGQGVLSLGQFLISAGLIENKEVSYLPAYGPEMRGGTANCSIVISNSQIASPLCENPDILVAMNAPSVDKFESKIASGGALLLNSSLINQTITRTDIKVYEIPANQLAEECGTVKAANMVMAGAVSAVSGAVQKQSIYKVIEERFADKPKLIEINKKACDSGFGQI